MGKLTAFQSAVCERLLLDIAKEDNKSQDNRLDDLLSDSRGIMIIAFARLLTLTLGGASIIRAGLVTGKSPICKYNFIAHFYDAILRPNSPDLALGEGLLILLIPGTYNSE